MTFCSAFRILEGDFKSLLQAVFSFFSFFANKAVFVWSLLLLWQGLVIGNLFLCYRQRTSHWQFFSLSFLPLLSSQKPPRKAVSCGLFFFCGSNWSLAEKNSLLTIFFFVFSSFISSQKPPMKRFRVASSSFVAGTSHWQSSSLLSAKNRVRTLWEGEVAEFKVRNMEFSKPRVRT